MSVKDIRLDENGDLLIKNGDFALNESDEAHIEHIITANKGYYFENPFVGVGIINEIKGATTSQELKQNIRRQLVLDNFAVKKIDISENYEISINAERRK